MALIKCPECGRENVSSLATACPNCGLDIKNYLQNAEQTDQDDLLKPVIQKQETGYSSHEIENRQTPQKNIRQIRYSQKERQEGNGEYGIICPVCGSQNISSQIFQENRESRTYTNTTSKYKEKGHGCLWWLIFGWWWWIVDLSLWILFFLPRLIIRLFASPYKKKKFTGRSTSRSETINDITYRTVHQCLDCDYTW